MTDNNNSEVSNNKDVADMPLINGSGARKNNNIVTIGGFIVISIIGIMFAFWQGSNDKKPEKKAVQESEIKSSLPPFVSVEPKSPAVVVAPQQPVVMPPPLPTPAPVVLAKDPNAKPVITPAMRKMDGNVIAVVGEKTQGAAATATQNPKKEPLSSEDNPLSNSLKPTKIASVSATKLPNRNFLLTKGATLGCVLETALDSSLAGLATCRLTRDVYSDNGAVILLDKGSKVVGEYQGGMKQGQKRLFLLWNRVETPNGVIIDINSPSTDPVGRTGVDGWVDNHFAERFGAAILVTLLQSATQAGTSYLQNMASSGGGTTTNIQGSSPQAATEVVKGILSQQSTIPPTLNKNQGDEVQIMIARDLDFSTIYALKAN